MNELILAEKAANWLRLKSLALDTDYKTVVQPRAERIHRVVWTGAAAGASPPAGGPTGPGWRRGPTCAPRPRTVRQCLARACTAPLSVPALQVHIQLQLLSARLHVRLFRRFLARVPLH